MNIDRVKINTSLILMRYIERSRLKQPCSPCSLFDNFLPIFPLHNKRIFKCRNEILFYIKINTKWGKDKSQMSKDNFSLKWEITRRRRGRQDCAQMGKIEASCHLVPSTISCCSHADNFFKIFPLPFNIL